MTVRVFYRKLGRIKYISHLDMVRCISRALKRSGLPVWHTLGFHPHVYLTFALPLALGYESTCESMDFRLTGELPMEEVVERLNAVLPEGVRCYRAAPAGRKPETIAWADYEITQEFDGMTAEAAAEKFAAWRNRETVPVVKKGKKGGARDRREAALFGAGGARGGRHPRFYDARRRRQHAQPQPHPAARRVRGGGGGARGLDAGGAHRGSGPGWKPI